jgi:exodeoxyribonuclease VII large subunit
MPTENERQTDLFARRPGPRVLTVSELTTEVKGLLEGKYAKVWVSGEVSNCRRQSSGHVYLNLKDDGASLQAVIFRSQARYLRFDLKDGLEVLAMGRLSVYAPRGQYQLIVDHVEPKGLGALQAAFEALKEKLAKEGLFDPNRKKPLPRLPRKVGVVTSPTGAAVRDFLRVLGRRNPHVSALIAPARVQGDGAAGEIARQLARLDARGDCDLIVLTRGGGSIEDLWAFNEEAVARAVAACRTPVVCAVGHEVDFTIADFVADLRAPTPSAAAEMIAPEHRAMVRELRGLRDRLGHAMGRRLEQRRARLLSTWGRIADPRRVLADRRLRLEALRERAESTVADALRRRERHLAGFRERLDRQHPRARLHRLHRDLEQRAMQLSAAVERSLGGARRRQAELAGKLDALSPLKVLGRGYALVQAADGRVVRAAGDVQAGDALGIRVGRGRIEATVTATDPTED